LDALIIINYNYNYFKVCNKLQETQLSPRGGVMLHVIDYFAKSLKSLN